MKDLSGKICLVHYQVMWHNGDGEHETFAFIDKNKASRKILSLYQSVEKWNKRHKLESELVREGFVRNEADDEFYIWFEEVNLDTEIV